MNPEVPQQPLNQEAKAESIKDNVIAKKIYQQFVRAREWYKQAAEQDRSKLKERFLEVFSGAEDVFDAFIETGTTPNIEQFLLAVAQNPLTSGSFNALIEGPQHEGKAGILLYEKKALDGGNFRLVLHLAPLDIEPNVQGMLTLRRQLKQAFKELAQLVNNDASIQEIGGYSWLFAKPGADSLLPKGFEKTEAKAAADDEPGFRGAQQSALIYDANALKEYLFEGKKPKTEGRVISRQAFLSATIDRT